MAFKTYLRSKRTWFYGFMIILGILGFHHYAFHEDNNHCEMTFMYQYPQFIPVRLNSNVTKRFPNYDLFIYGEGEYAMSLGESFPRGVPVLFIPGNGGSYKQVRSFGSIALRMGEESHSSKHLNFFTINFNEELSGLFGPMLQQQTEFLYECIVAIKNLYQRELRKDVHLILIGHSIGGLMARGVFTLDGFDPSHVDLIVTLAAPHTQPAIQFDSYMSRYYQRLNTFWRENRHSDKLAHLSIISIGGGFSDKLVRSDLTMLPVQSDTDLSLVTTAVSDVWLSMDHLCIVWCRQLIVKLTRLLYEIVDFRSRSVVQAQDWRTSTIGYHLINRNRGASVNQHVPDIINIPRKGQWIYKETRYFKYHKQKIFEPTYLLVPLVPNMVFVVLTTNLLRKDWIIGCNVTHITTELTTKKICESGVNLSQESRLLYKTHGLDRKLFKQETNNLLERGFDHILIYLAPSPSTVSVIGERYPLGRRNKIILLPSIGQDLLSLIFPPTTIATVPVTEEAIFYNFTLVGQSQIWHNYWVRIEMKQCYESASEYSILHYWIPWSREDNLQQIGSVKGKRATMTLRLNAPRPDPTDTRYPHLYLLLEPSCGYVLKLKLSFIEVLTQMIRHYYNTFLPLIGAILISALSHQIHTQRRSSIATLLVNSPDTKDKNGPKVTSSLGGLMLFRSLPVVLHENFMSISMYGLLPWSNIITDKILELVSVIAGIEHTSTWSHLSLVQSLFLHIVLYIFTYSMLYIGSSILHLLLLSFTKLYITTKNLIFKELDTSSLLGNQKLRIGPILISLLLILIALLSCSCYCLLMVIFLHFYNLLSAARTARLWSRKKGPSLWSSLADLDLTLLLLQIVAFVPTIPIGLVYLKYTSADMDYGTLSATLSSNVDFHTMPIVCITLSIGILLQPTHLFRDYSPSLNILTAALKVLSLATLGLGLRSYDYITKMVSTSLLCYSFYRLICIWPNKRTKTD